MDIEGFFLGRIPSLIYTIISESFFTITNSYFLSEYNIINKSVNR